MPESLNKGDILRVVNGYVGVTGGFVGELSARNLAEFYPFFCKLDIDPAAFEGTTRDRFIAILETAPPEHQARILNGILLKFPVGSVPPRGSEARRNKQMAEFVESLAARLTAEAGVV